MRSPYGLEIIESCFHCKHRTERLFCDLPDNVLQDFDALKYANVFPKGAMLFVEGQSPRGIFVLCSGRTKLSTCSSDGKALIMQIAEPGDVLGLSATISGKPYEVSAETLEHCQVNFVKRDEFLKFLARHGEACLKIAEHLSNNYHTAYEQIRSLGLSHSAGEKLAKLILEWCEKGEETKQGIRLKLTLTHEEIAQMIGTSRETVTRLIGEFKGKQLIHLKGSNLVIRDRSALEKLVTS